MFRRKKDEPEETAKAPEPTPVRAAAQPNPIPPAPPPSPTPAAERKPVPPAAPIRPETPRPMAATPAAPTVAAPRPATPAAAEPPADEGQRLIVGKGIVLNGEITACDRLVVEGKVEATLNKTRSIEISPTGVFKGAAEIEQATVAGLYDGKLTCRGKLTIRGTGRVQGEIRYREIEIEVGGVISGNVGATTG
jgi:cytoskeletal protein CcmA (bactofilin family)